MNISSIISNFKLNELLKLSNDYIYLSEEIKYELILKSINHEVINNIDSFFKLFNIAINIREININLSTEIFLKLDKINYGHGAVFTEICINSFRNNNINVFHPGYVSCNLLGKYGRFGNQVLQYFSLEIISTNLKLIKSHPKWIGNYIFEIPESNHNLSLQVASKDLIDDLFHNKITIRNFDLGEYLLPPIKLCSQKKLFKNTFKLRKELDFSLELFNFGFDPNNSITVHVRTTDFINIGKNVDFDIIYNFLCNHIIEKQLQIVWVVSDSPDFYEIYKNKLPLKNLILLDKKYQNLDFLYDWQLLSLSHHCLYNLESTFSLTAYLHSENNSNCFSYYKEMNKILPIDINLL